MIKQKRTLFLGIFIFLIPFLGLPTSWKTVLVILSGLGLVTLSVKFSLPKKPIRTKGRREKSTPVFVESMPVYHSGKISGNNPQDTIE
ncbi:MAG TPA: hypothetical protein VJG67_00135 [Candidatus Paceibacterota bacterium]